MIGQTLLVDYRVLNKTSKKVIFVMYVLCIESDHFIYSDDNLTSVSRFIKWWQNEVYCIRQ